MQQQMQHDPGPDQATGTSVTPTQDATTTLPPVALAPVDDPEWESAWSTYWAALESGDRHGALAVVRERHEGGAAPMEVIERLVVPAQARIGDLWLTGGWSVAQEHQATAINEGLVHWLGSFAPEADASAPLVIVSCLEHERHALPALIVAESLLLAGYRVTYVGGDPEPAGLLHDILSLKPRAVLFSASLTSSLAGQKSLFSSIRAIGIPVVVGGQAFGGDETRALALGATAYAATPGEAARVIDALPPRVPQTGPAEAGPADVEAAWIADYHHEIAPYVVRAIAARHDVAVGAPSSAPDWWTDFPGYVDHVLGCLAAALVVGDETIMIEVRDWLERVLEARHAPDGLVAEVWGLLAEPLRGHPLARVHLAGAAPGHVPGQVPG
ncbi:cobalamin B12-binding domain-containing protein [Nocardioides kribbensis]|uniref:Cobalamin-dependent protein n=1 Tax=Nocardioides kribbensis TaxID=305517 RepID=A0ABV1P424_9ACTN